MMGSSGDVCGHVLLLVMDSYSFSVASSLCRRILGHLAKVPDFRNMDGFSMENLYGLFATGFGGDNFEYRGNGVSNSFSSSNSNCDALRSLTDFLPVKVVVVFSITKGTVHALSPIPALSAPLDILLEIRLNNGRRVGIQAHTTPRHSSSDANTALEAWFPYKNCQPLLSSDLFEERTGNINSSRIDFICHGCTDDVYDDVPNLPP